MPEDARAKNSMSKRFAILLAAGKSRRMNGAAKPYLLYGGFPLFYFPLKKMAAMKGFTRGVVVVRKGDRRRVEGAIKQWKIKNVTVVEGGTTRQASMQKGMKALEKAAPKIPARSIIVVHNAASPFAPSKEFEAVAKAAEKYGAAGVGHPMVDTVKEVKIVSPSQSFGKKTLLLSRIIRTVDRKNLWQMQTPQAFQYRFFAQAKSKKIFNHSVFTDEMGWIEALGMSPVMIEADPLNRKITTAADFFTRTGIGLDSHRFNLDHSRPPRHVRGLTLGGVHFPNRPKLLANSDGDVMLHALCNALLQAVGQSSFSAIADPLCRRGITDSREYLKKILKIVCAHNFTLAHVGFQLEGRKPRIDPLVPKLKSSLSKLLKLAPENIGITATSGEDLTPFGRGEGLQCFAVVTLTPMI